MKLARRGPNGLALVLDDGEERPIRTANGEVIVRDFYSSYDYWGGGEDQYWNEAALLFLQESATLLLVVSSMESNSYSGERTASERAYRSVDGGRTWTEVEARWPEHRVALAHLSTREGA